MKQDEQFPYVVMYHPKTRCIWTCVWYKSVVSVFNDYNPCPYNDASFSSMLIIPVGWDFSNT